MINFHTMSKLNENFLGKVICVALFLVLLLPPNSESFNYPSRFFYDNQGPSAALLRDNEAAQDDVPNVDATNLKLLNDNGGQEIPLEFYSKLDNVTDAEEFIELFVNKESIDPQWGIIGKNLKRNVERASVVIPKSAGCIPENTVVPLTPLNPSKDPKILYYPKCTRVKRCGGCCASELMSCQPTATETLNFEVTKFHHGEKTLRGKEIVVVEQHTVCRCACRIKAEDCNAYQQYRPDLCRCICTNDEAREKCLQQEHKIWDDQACRCICNATPNCTTGTFFDDSQCKCVDPIFKGAGPSLEERRRYIVKAVAVDPDNSTIYDAV